MEDDPYPPPTPVTESVNTIPPRVDHSVLPARMLEALVMKNHLLKHLQVTRVGPASDVRDPGFNAMKDPALILWAIVGVFNTAGYSVTIRDREAILKYGKEALAAEVSPPAASVSSCNAREKASASTSGDRIVVSGMPVSADASAREHSESQPSTSSRSAMV
ncbi:hypothetical protein P43SY_000350 [Pythium insidiosum]|uniref:Uncharacterized protein n=1 Tax=Pythium insidiosum TaxID=114742 RepID=A0AAD5LR92_PYTIN|nr:hypothetical protein P43SY_000350 [Pythium insidiosum]